MVTDYIPRKHLFTVHSGITVVMLNLIITYFKLDPKNVYVLSRGNCFQSVVNLGTIPRQNILNSDIFNQAQADCFKSLNEQQDYTSAQYYEQFYQVNRFILNTVYTLLDDNIDDDLKIQTNCQLKRDYFSPVDFNKLKEGTESKYYEPYEQPTRIDQNLDFNFYTQHSMDIVFNIVLHSKHCRTLHYVEEGTLNYIKYDLALYEEHDNHFTDTEQAYPQFSYQHLGVHRHQFHTLHQFDDSKNPNINYDHSGFISLSELAFSKINVDHKWEGKAINRHIIAHAASHHIPKQQNPYYLEQLSLIQNHPAIVNSESIQQALQQPEYIGNFVNIVVCENYVSCNLSEQEYLDAHKGLIRSVVEQGVFFFFIKFHPLCETHLNQKIIEFIEQEVSVLYSQINVDVCLEQVFCEAEANTFIVHTITSSLGLYASKFLQLTFTYPQFYENFWFYKNLCEEKEFNLKEIIDYFYYENKVMVNYEK